MSEQEAVRLGYEMDTDYPIYSVLFKNGKLVKAFLIQNFGWRFPTLHHPEVLKFVAQREKEAK